MPLSEQTKIHRALREHEQRLRLELATQKDPAAIERVAREQLHMAPPIRRRYAFCLALTWRRPGGEQQVVHAAPARRAASPGSATAAPTAGQRPSAPGGTP